MLHILCVLKMMLTPCKLDASWAHLLLISWAQIHLLTSLLNSLSISYNLNVKFFRDLKSIYTRTVLHPFPQSHSHYSRVTSAREKPFTLRSIFFMSCLLTVFLPFFHSLRCQYFLVCFFSTLCIFQDRSFRETIQINYYWLGISYRPAVNHFATQLFLEQTTCWLWKTCTTSKLTPSRVFLLYNWTLYYFAISRFSH